MIDIKLDDGVTDIFMTRVDHLNSAQSAAQALWESVYALSKVHGGAVELVNDERRQRVGVKWEGGPSQWADAYVVCEGATAPEFTSVAEGHQTVFFLDMDA